MLNASSPSFSSRSSNVLRHSSVWKHPPGILFLRFTGEIVLYPVVVAAGLLHSENCETLHAGA